MPVPPSDTVCRFVRTEDWSERESRPKASAFKGPDLSVWSIERLEIQGSDIEDLCIESLAGSGQAHHKVEDYFKCARQAFQETGEPFEVQVEWRPDDSSVKEPWREWKDAHAQVEATKGPRTFPPEFRIRLATKTRRLVHPEKS